MSKKEVQNLFVTENTPLNNSNFLIRLKSNSNLPAFKPGQFINIEISNSSDVFLRRPFSVFDVDHNNNSLTILVKILGRGSKKLTEIKIGQEINVIYPLGKGFTFPDHNDKILLIGGGSGVAPMLFLAKVCGLRSNKVDLILGAKTKNDHISVESYADYARFYFSTDDGTLGEKGFVTQNPVFTMNLKSYTKIYACGPEAMMKSVANEAKRLNIFCEVSLENLMACGFGVCLCCIEPTIKGNLCVCTEGPVFNINELKWQI